MTEHPGPEPARPSLRASGSRGRVDPVWDTLISVLTEHESRRPDATLDVVDVGGGSGVYAVQIAARGHRVTVVDPSPNALATLRRRAIDADVADRIMAIQGDAGGLADLVPAGRADLVLCHGVLDVVDDPADATAAVAELAADGAPVSVVVAGRHGAVVGRVFAGHVTEALAILRSEDGTYGGADPLPRRFTLDELSGLLGSAGLAIRLTRGVRTFGDIVGSGGTDEIPDSAEIATIDHLVAEDAAFRSLAATLHVVAERGIRSG